MGLSARFLANGYFFQCQTCYEGRSLYWFIPSKLSMQYSASHGHVPLVPRGVPSGAIGLAFHFVGQFTDCTHSHHMRTLTPYAHTHTICTHSHHMHTLTPYVHTHTICTHSHHMHTLTPYAHTHTICTHSHHMHTLTHICTHSHHMHTLTPYAHTHTICTHSHHMHTLTHICTHSHHLHTLTHMRTLTPYAHTHTICTHSHHLHTFTLYVHTQTHTQEQIRYPRIPRSSSPQPVVPAEEELEKYEFDPHKGIDEGYGGPFETEI